MLPTIDFNNIQDLINYIDQFIITNHNNEIIAIQHNNIENGLSKFIIQSPRNWDKASVINTAENYVAIEDECILIFNQLATGSVTLTNNKWNEWTIDNRTSSNKQLVGSIANYKTVIGTIKNYVAAQSSVTIAKGSDNLWYEISNTNSSNTVGVKFPLTGVVGGGSNDDPVNGLSTFQNDKLIGLGSTNDGKCQIEIDGLIQYNYGGISSFDLNNSTGVLDISPNIFITDSALYIDLNQ